MIELKRRVSWEAAASYMLKIHLDDSTADTTQDAIILRHSSAVSDVHHDMTRRAIKVQ